MTTVLSLQQVSFSQAGVQLLDGIDFSVDKNCITGLLGVNGAGKSTTLKLAAGVLLPQCGRICYHGSPKLGYVPETPPLIPSWSVYQCLQHACKLQGLAAREHAKAIALAVQQCNLDDIQHQPTATLSKGNRQRVAIAQALLHQPDLLILDEPTAGLDPHQIHLFRELLTAIRPQTAILFSSHIMQEVSALCEQVVIIHAGKQLDKLDLQSYRQSVEITFNEAVESRTFASLNSWQGGREKQHRFLVNSIDEHRELLDFCRQKNLLIMQLQGGERVLENEFLTRIGAVLQ